MLIDSFGADHSEGKKKLQAPAYARKPAKVRPDRPPANGPTQEASFFTNSRGDIVHLAKQIAGHLDREFFKDPDNPVLISVSGTNQSGKSIFLDVLSLRLMGFAEASEWRVCDYRLRKERRSGMIDGTLCEIDFMNDVCGEIVPGRISDSFAERQHGGIVIVQNGSEKLNRATWLDIHVAGEVTEGPGLTFSYMTEQGIFEEVADLAARSPGGWTRLVTFTVQHEKLLTSPLFQKFWSTLTEDDSEKLIAAVDPDHGLGRAPSP